LRKNAVTFSSENMPDENNSSKRAKIDDFDLNIAQINT
jgi:hypothetical protein